MLNPVTEGAIAYARKRVDPDSTVGVAMNALADEVERLRNLISRMALDGHTALSPDEKNAIAEIVNAIRS